MRQKIVDVIQRYWDFDGICIPSNGEIRSDGQAVMGKGFALAMREKWRDIGKRLGGELSRRGNVPSFLGCVNAGGYYSDFNAADTAIFSFPTKKHWRDKSDLKLITESAKKMVILAEEYELENIALPRPGCGAGGLLWADVEPVLAQILDDRFCATDY
jgi:O-acetyl-ADP-ribose deacetylase (regulator of RNase III)